MDFPTLVYRSPGPHAGPASSKGYDFRGAKSEAELADLLADGWSLSFDEAVNGKPATIIPKGVTREELLAEAERLGIKIDKRWSDERIAAAIGDS